MINFEIVSKGNGLIGDNAWSRPRPSEPGCLTTPVYRAGAGGEGLVGAGQGDNMANGRAGR